MRYEAYDFYNKSASAMHNIYGLILDIGTHPLNPYSHTPIGRTTNAALEFAMRLTKSYEKLDFDIDSVLINDKTVRVREEVVLSKSFCELVHFKRVGREDKNKVLLVAPLSGHHATLLKGTVEGLLPDHEVYVTDWLDAREVPLDEGAFTFDLHVSYLIDFLQFLGQDVHLVAICQPAVQALIATAVMAEEKNTSTPKTLTLMAGPIDVSKNPTRVNKYSQEHSMDWFRGFAIMTVPPGYPGEGREVYPGFLQLGGFLSMNLDMHISKYLGFFQNLLEGDEEDADCFRAFYDEYMAVLDIPAEFYLETIERVFKANALARNSITYNGKSVNFGAINNTALLTVEGASDDVCGIGQTQAAHALCKNIPETMRCHHLQEGAGHYGIFSGSRFRKYVRPLVTEFIHDYS
ncbi:polyhydroxyalkanoate depolymerase [Endozoicomonas atrinae]|uniref:polyhydroxyalkanoate depolymerase n=1 Tax=Endozoicomonas atrinae TaxID=1333660 RepID=UPI000825D7B7|nr:polyhydroxyalkanoate depolymerase [Endozoicomonas atrinae]